MQAVHSLGNCDIILITRSLGLNSLLVRIWLRRTARQTNYPVRLLPFPDTLVSVSGSKQPSGRGVCETTVSLATYNNQIHRKITQNTLKLIARLKQHTREKHTTQPNLLSHVSRLSGSAHLRCNGRSQDAPFLIMLEIAPPLFSLGAGRRYAHIFRLRRV